MDTPDEEAGPCSEIVTPFLINMYKILNATRVKLSRSVRLGYVIIPHNMRDYIPVMDHALHHVFDCVHNPQADDDIIEYDILELAVGMQYGYNLTDPQDRWGLEDYRPWPRDPITPPFREDDHMLYVNVEDDFLEVGYRCLHIYCWAPARRKVVLNPRRGLTVAHLTLQKQDPNRIPTGQDVSGNDSVSPPLSLEFGSIVAKIARHIAEFVAENPYEGGENGKLRYILLAGGASPDLISAVTVAFSYAFPDADPEMFLTARDPAFLPSLGAAQMVRNKLVNERHAKESLYCGRIW